MLLLTPTFVYSLTFPRPIGLVNDYANILSDREEGILNLMLSDIEKNTTNEITIVIVNDLQGESIEMYAVGIFKEFGIGKEGKDNGLLILHVPSQYKYRIEVGYGLEGDLNDAKVGDIARECIETNFSKQKYYDGYRCTIERIKENLTPVQNKKEDIVSEGGSLGLFLVAGTGFFLLVLVALGIIFKSREKT